MPEPLFALDRPKELRNGLRHAPMWNACSTFEQPGGRKCQKFGKAFPRVNFRHQKIDVSSLEGPYRLGSRPKGSPGLERDWKYTLLSVYVLP